MKTCDYCGQENAESVQFCQGCGTDLSPAPSPSVTHMNWKRVRWVKTFFIALLAGILTYPIAGSIGYFRMRAFLATPNHPPVSVGPDIAWIVAFFWSFVVFVVVFVIGIFVFKKREA